MQKILPMLQRLVSRGYILITFGLNTSFSHNYHIMCSNISEERSVLTTPFLLYTDIYVCLMLIVLLKCRSSGRTMIATSTNYPTCSIQQLCLIPYFYISMEALVRQRYSRESNRVFLFISASLYSMRSLPLYVNLRSKWFEFAYR